MATPSAAAPQVADNSKGEQAAAHMQQHPHQQITALTFELRYVQVRGIDAKRYIFGSNI